MMYSEFMKLARERNIPVEEIDNATYKNVVELVYSENDNIKSKFEFLDLYKMVGYGGIRAMAVDILYTMRKKKQAKIMATIQMVRCLQEDLAEIEADIKEYNPHPEGLEDGRVYLSLPEAVEVYGPGAN